MDDEKNIIRLFIGIEFPEVMKKEVDHFLTPLHKNSKGWEKPWDYHQTLLFIGATPLELLADIKNRLDQFSFTPFTLETSGFKFFNRRIMYLDFLPSQELSNLVLQIQQLFPEWVRDNEKAFVPHMTVKRWQRYEFDELKSGLEKRKFKDMKIRVHGIALFKSERDLVNNKYHVIHRIEF